ncbi:hypothetical protein ACQREA_15405 [Dietzia cinnamea]|uniref:hypothetical protein n=1 Tax=Dietzia cinnamea TaxID=321318 RepID=UPI003D00ABC7
MILVNVSRSAVGAVTEQQLMEAASKYWKVAEESIRGYGDYLAAVRDNTIVGVWRVLGHSRPDDSGGKVVFELGAAPERADLIGQEVPNPWVRGAANPIKLWDYQPEAVPSDDTQSAMVCGWHIEALPGGRLQVRSPNGNGPLYLESLTSEPAGGVAILRTLSENH